MKKIVLLILLCPLLTFAQTAKQYLKQGNSYLDSYNYQAAFDSYTQAIILKPDYTEAHKQRLITRTHLGNQAGVINDLNEIISAEPKNIKLYQQRANLKYSLKDYQGAVEDYSRIIELDASNINALPTGLLQNSLLKIMPGRLMTTNVPFCSTKYTPTPIITV